MVGRSLIQIHLNFLFNSIIWEEGVCVVYIALKSLKHAVILLEFILSKIKTGRGRKLLKVIITFFAHAFFRCQLCNMEVRLWI